MNDDPHRHVPCGCVDILAIFFQHALFESLLVCLVRGREWMGYDHPWISGYGSVWFGQMDEIARDENT